MPGCLRDIAPLIIIAIAAVLVVYMNRRFDYQCGYCGEIFSLPTVDAIFAPHMMGKKLVTCPRCGQRTWASLVPKGK